MSIDYSDVSIKFGVSNFAPANATIEYYTEPPQESYRRRNIVALSLIAIMLLSSICICIYCRYFHKFDNGVSREADAIAYAEPLNRPVTIPDQKDEKVHPSPTEEEKVREELMPSQGAEDEE